MVQHGVTPASISHAPAHEGSRDCVGTMYENRAIISHTAPVSRGMGVNGAAVVAIATKRNIDIDQIKFRWVRIRFLAGSGYSN